MLVMIPEVFIVQYKKYNAKWSSASPEILKFKHSKNKLLYQLVSQSQHSGGQSGGHYWSISKRNGGVFKLYVFKNMFKFEVFKSSLAISHNVDSHD
jgi:hypothetical protein